MEKVFLLLLAAHLLVRWLAPSAPGGTVLRLAVYAAGLILLIKFARVSAKRVLWRVRNRMIVLFLFIGVVPLLLVTALVGLAGYVLTGQVAVYMASSELDRRAGRLQGTANNLVWSLLAADPSRRVDLIASYLEQGVETWPGLEILVREGERLAVFPPGSSTERPRPELRGYRGIVLRGGRFYLMVHASSTRRPPPPAQEPASVTAPRERPPEPPPQGRLEVTLLQPLPEAYLSGLVPGLGRISFFPGRRQDFAEPRAEIPPPAYRFDYEVIWGTAPFEVERWSESDVADGGILLRIQTRPSAVFRRLFGQRVEVAQGVTVAFFALGTLFLIVELLSLVTGLSITRTVTQSVHELYEGTQWVNQGDFSHRINAGGNDQLAELARSFNSMTESIQRLIEESKERERLASELQIAREVQEQLFPKEPPVMKGLEILGVCNAARMVSGDYFDFVKMSDDRLALAIGDVAGKGISGALLMASIQSALRTQLSLQAAAQQPDGGVWRFPTAQLVGRLNLQLYHNTTPEKYATFFFAAYDDSHSLLTYTNAGHLPPVLIRRGGARRLEVNGLVVGAFPFARYDQSEIELEPGDLIVAFTDGVTEPENEFAEEFGEERLIELLIRHQGRPPREIIDEVIRAVTHWTGRPELQDDMTLMVARRVQA